uniref:SAP30-binding protein n=1 Tax=Aegilops tauschii TaxID=37682 RepID=M8BH88_AEGTA
MAMSPDQEDGEIMSGIGSLGSDAQDAEGILEERVLSGTVHILTPKVLSETSQHLDAPEQNQMGADVPVDVTGTEAEDARVEEASDISTNVQNDDPLSRFLPPPVTTKCSTALQQRINKFLGYKRSGKSFNAEVRNRKDYRNPDFLQHAVRYQEIDQIGTCFSKDVFNPYGYDKSDYYDEIDIPGESAAAQHKSSEEAVMAEADMKRELERKEQEKKRNPRIDFTSSGVQPPINPSIAKISAAISAAAVAGVSVPASADTVQKEARPNKKSKWDKVDGDTKNPAAASGLDNRSAAGGSATLLTSENAGAGGYAAFAQQKRKEAEERRTSDYKSDRRS